MDLEIASRTGVRRGAAEDQYLVTLQLSPSGEAVVSLTREQARDLAQSLIDTAELEVESK